MYDSIFNRIEQKYLLDETSYKLLIEKSKKLRKDKFFKSKINNIYFDNELIKSFIGNSIRTNIGHPRR